MRIILGGKVRKEEGETNTNTEKTNQGNRKQTHQIRKKHRHTLFWQSRYGSCAYLGMSLVWRRILTVRARPSRWMGLRFKGNQKVALISTFFIIHSMINSKEHFPAVTRKKTGIHSGRFQSVLSFLVWEIFSSEGISHCLWLCYCCLQLLGGRVGEWGSGRDGWQVPDQLSFLGNN